MYNWFFVGLLLLTFTTSRAQLPENELLPDALTEDVLVDESSHWLEQLGWEHPDKIKWNQADRLQLLQLPGMNENLLLEIEKHQQRFGPLLDFEELQQIAGISPEMLKNWRKLVVTGTSGKTTLPEIQACKQQILWRSKRILQEQQGYSPGRAAQNLSYYPGTTWQHLLRYRLDSPHLKIGLVIEKDAGENQKHLSFSIAGGRSDRLQWILGDMRYGAGFGLTMNTGFYAGKSSDPLLAIPYTAGLRPSASAAEWHRLRGAGLSLSLSKYLQAEIMFSYSLQHSTLQQDETRENAVIQNLYTAGLFRTGTEQSKWRNLRETTAAASVQWKKKHYLLGLNTVFHHWPKNFLQGTEAYQRFDFQENQQWLNSFHGRYNWKNLTHYGELAFDAKLHTALLTGFLWPPHPKFGWQGSFRRYHRAYFAFLGQSLSTKSELQGEQGWVIGCWWEPAKHWKIQLLSDQYQWDWLRFQLDKPAGGLDKLLVIHYQATRQQQWLFRLRSVESFQNRSQTGPALEAVYRWQGRLQLRLVPHPDVECKLSWQHHRQLKPSYATGNAFWQSVRYQHPDKKWSFQSQICLFATDNFDTRLYVREGDLRYAVSMSSVSGEGQRWLLTAQWKPFRNWELGLRYAVLRHFDSDHTGSGLDEIDGPERSELKGQIIAKF